jgi:hypothetical protein
MANSSQKKKTLQEITDRIQIAMQNNVMTVPADMDERSVAEAAAKRHVGGYTIDYGKPVNRAAYTVLQKLTVPTRYTMTNDQMTYPLPKLLPEREKAFWNTGGSGYLLNEDGTTMGMLHGITIPAGLMWADANSIEKGQETGHYHEIMNAINFMNQMQAASPEGAEKYETMRTSGANGIAEYVSNIDNYQSNASKFDTAQHELSHKVTNMGGKIRDMVNRSSADEEDFIRMYDKHYGGDPRTREEATNWINESVVGHANEFNTGYGDDLNQLYSTIENLVGKHLAKQKQGQ